MSILGTLVPEGPWYVFHATRCQVYWDLTCNVVFCWYWFDITNTRTQTQRYTTLKGQKNDTQPYKYLFTPPVTCSQQLSLLHWMNNSLILNNNFPHGLFFSRIIHLCKSYLLIWCYETRLSVWNTNNTGRNGVNKITTHTRTRTHTPNTPRKITLTSVS